MSLVSIFRKKREQSNSLKYILHKLKQIIYGGNLSVRFQGSEDDQYAELKSELNVFAERIENIFADVSALTGEINQVSFQIISSIAEQNSVANQQASSVAEITSTMEELSATSRQISVNANSVLAIANDGLAKADTGVKSIENLKHRMEIINQDNNRSSTEIVNLGKKSAEISSVMEIIKGIADQTKLIAFNAALEAASAGEAGKRFGIVAVEIRRLADNVTESTKDIAEKIKDIQAVVNSLVVASEKSSREVEQGVEEAHETVTILREIFNSARTNADAARQISTSTQQQESASSQVVLAIKEISEGAKSNMKAVEASSKIIEQLGEKAIQMEGKLTDFELGDRLFEWNDLYLTGIASYDDNNRKMLNHFFKLHKLLLIKNSPEDVANICRALLQTARETFSHEENLMEQYQFPEAASHRAEHEKFLEKIQKYVTVCENKKLLNTRDVAMYLKSWMNKHILLADLVFIHDELKKK